jgi:hypothetical protein
MKGSRPGRIPRPSRTADRDRICAEPGCTTKLSVYNTRAKCWQHTEIVFPNYRGRRWAPEGKA